MTRGDDVLVDGSLRNATWYESHFKMLRTHFPRVRIAIIEVATKRELVISRAAKRAESTGRTVPARLLEAAIDEVPCAVAKLIPLVDFVARFNTDANIPVLETVVKEFEGCTWPFQCDRVAARDIHGRALS